MSKGKLAAQRQNKTKNFQFKCFKETDKNVPKMPITVLCEYANYGL